MKLRLDYVVYLLYENMESKGSVKAIFHSLFNDKSSENKTKKYSLNKIK